MEVIVEKSGRLFHPLAARAAPLWFVYIELESGRNCHGAHVRLLWRKTAKLLVLRLASDYPL